jgi:pseudouridine synthase
MMRLQKYMAQSGVASRRACEQIILEGKVKVNGRKVTEMGFQVNEKSDIVHVQGKRIGTFEQKAYYMLNKPRGYLSTSCDERGRKTVMDLIPKKDRLYPVGRLDQNTSGLIILTNDGDLTYGLTHPKHHIPKTYVIKVTPIPTKEQLAYLRKGGDIGPYVIGPCEIQTRAVEEDKASYTVTINEGKNHQVRNMFEYCGCEVITLKRIAIGKLTLKGLNVGKTRELELDEVSYLKKLVDSMGKNQ